MGYARDTFVENPWREGLLRFGNWGGFHATCAAGALWCFSSPGERQRLPLLLWLVVGVIGVIGGHRFYPRYFFLLLPIVVLAGARGLLLMPSRARTAALALLLIPLIRFGPRYATLGADLVLHRPHQWTDLALNTDSREAAGLIGERGGAATLLAWGYRPDLFVYTRAGAEAPYLDSQPLTGVLADRHLFDARATFPELAAANRRSLVATQPEYIVDGLGPLNPRLAIAEYPELRHWLEDYQVVGRTTASIIYERHSAARPAGDPLVEER